MSVPSPAFISDNNWRDIPVPPRGEFVPSEKVSVIIPYYNAPNELAIVLKALEYQTYPKELTEIIIAADYPDDTLDESKLSLDIKVYRQPHKGFGVGRARNMGAYRAKGSILVFFDGDIVPSPWCVEEHARWHHQANNLLTIGDRWFVRKSDVSLSDIPRVLYELTSGSITIPMEKSHHRNLIDLTDEFTSGGDTVYQGVIGHNFGIRRDTYLALGGNRDESRHWGFEDTEFGFRAYTRGNIIVFVDDAVTLHLGMQDYLKNPDKVRGHRLQSALMEDYIADYRFRDAKQGRSFVVPEYIVNIYSPDPLITMEVAIDVLSNHPYDLIVRLDLDDNTSDEAIIVRRRLLNDLRVKFATSASSLDDFPDSPLHMYIKTDSIPKRKIVQKMRKLLGHRAMVYAEKQDYIVSMERSWAAHRARLCKSNISDVGQVREVKWSKIMRNNSANIKHSSISSSKLERTLKLTEKFRTVGDMRRVFVHRLRSLFIRP